MNYYISDLHFGHKNCLTFDPRPFKNTDEMDSYIINKWNSKVSNDDHVWILGDICYRAPHTAAWYLYQLRGHKHLVLGNHDWGIAEDQGVANALESIDSLKRIEDENRIVILCHYPILVWDQKHRGAYHVYGHVHAQDNDCTRFMMIQERAHNAGCMLNDYEPCTLEELEKNHQRRLNNLSTK